MITQREQKIIDYLTSRHDRFMSIAEEYDDNSSQFIVTIFSAFLIEELLLNIKKIIDEDQ